MVSEFGFRVSSFGVRLSSFGFRVSSVGVWVSSFGVRVSSFGFRVSSFGFRVSSFEVRVSPFGFRVKGFGFQGSYKDEEGLEATLPRDQLVFDRHKPAFRKISVRLFIFHCHSLFFSPTSFSFFLFKSFRLSVFSFMGCELDLKVQGPGISRFSIGTYLRPRRGQFDGFDLQKNG